MNPQEASFIPKRPTQVQAKRPGARKVYVLTYVSYIIFFATVFSAMGLFFYGGYLDGRLEAMKAQLIEEESRFNEEEVDAVRKLNDQIVLATERMENHLSVLPIFNELEKSVSQKISFTSFSYAREEGVAPKIELAGSAMVLGSIIFQRDFFRGSALLSSAEFTGVALGSAVKENGLGVVPDVESEIAFTLEKQVPMSLLRYTAPAIAPETAEVLSSSEEEGSPFADEEEIVTESNDSLE